MTVMIVTSFGATHRYPDQDMMRLTFRAFLNSIRNQTGKDLRLFISHHDKPKGVDCDDPFIYWCPVSGSPDHQKTLVPRNYPKTPMDLIDVDTLDYGISMTDMSRKTYNSVMWAGKYAYRERLSSFWMLRMDSDDLLANDMVALLHDAQRQGLRAIYNRTCHMFDPKRREIAIYAYPYSTTCNALFYELKGDQFIPDWYYHCNDHTSFASMVQKDGIVHREIDFTFCIVTNSGNSISERPEIAREKNTVKIALTESLIKRYGLESLL